MPVVSSNQEYFTRNCSGITVPAVPAAPVRIVVPSVVMSVNGPPTATAHCRSLAGLLARAGSGDADQSG